MSFDQLTETVTRRLATGTTRRTFLGRMGAAVAAIGAAGLGGGTAAAAGTRTFTFVNSSGQNILVGSFGPNGTSPLGGGWAMTPGQTRVVTVPDTFSGRFWGRTLCTSNGLCETGDCGAVACNGGTGVPPATLAEVTLGPGVGVTFDDYDVSLVDGYNLPITMVPVNGTGQCTPAGCTTDFNATCPPALQKVDNAGHVIGCMSACIAFRTDQFCCSGAFGTPQTCIPTQWPVNYAAFFKSSCPNAYSYPYDDPTSNFTCTANAYTITFWPFINPQASGGAGPIRASGFAAQFGTTKETTSDTGGGQDVTSIVNGSWLQYNNIDFGTTAATQFLVRVASGAPAGVSGLVEMRLDSRTNPALASLAVANTGGWQSWTTLAINMSPVTGTHTVFLTFSSGQPAHFVNVNWFEFGH
ncbi:MAG TPA: thaumatin family protein [Pseudonocardiaceae bacterium]|nr:thaumatin family protein [Pseudonocardiaceae bacterium]